MSYLFAFAPWIVYAVVPSSQWRWGALVGLVITVAVTVRGLSARRPPAAMIIEFGSVVFFSAATAFAFAQPHTALHSYLPAIANGWLALISWFSLAVGQPFTLGIARQNTPRDAWHQPLFIRTNVIITTVWAVAFTLGAVAAAVCAAAGVGRVALIVIHVAAFALPMLFTVRYVAIVRARVAAIHQAAAEPVGTVYGRRPAGTVSARGE